MRKKTTYNLAGIVTMDGEERARWVRESFWHDGERKVTFTFYLQEAKVYNDPLDNPSDRFAQERWQADVHELRKLFGTDNVQIRKVETTVDIHRI